MQWTWVRTEPVQVHQPPSDDSNSSDSISRKSPFSSFSFNPQNFNSSDHISNNNTYNASGLHVPYEPMVRLLSDLWYRSAQKVHGLHLHRCCSSSWAVQGSRPSRTPSERAMQRVWMPKQIQISSEFVVWVLSNMRAYMNIGLHFQQKWRGCSCGQVH